MLKTWNEFFQEQKFTKGDILSKGFIFSKFPEFFKDISIYPENDAITTEEQKTIYDIDLFNELSERYVPSNIEKLVTFYDSFNYEQFIKVLMVIINRSHYLNWSKIYKDFMWEYDHGSNYDLIETREVKHTGDVTRVETNTGSESTVTDETTKNTGTESTAIDGTISNTGTESTDIDETSTNSGTDTVNTTSNVTENKTESSRYGFNSANAVPTETNVNTNSGNSESTTETDRTTTNDSSSVLTLDRTTTNESDSVLTVDRTTTNNSDVVLTKDLTNNATDTFNTVDTETISRTGDLSVRAIQDTLQNDINLWKANVFYNIVLSDILSTLSLSIWKGGE